MKTTLDFIKAGEMTPEFAHRILHPDTTAQTIHEIRYYHGLNGNEASLDAVYEACEVACKALELMMQIEERGE